ncbi:MAG TPA: zinc-binding dehydrogenase, partial [Nitriliruptorales bacterium]
GSRALVIGPGPIGLATVYALSYLAPDVEITVAGLGPFADAFALQAGARHLVHGTRRELVEDAARVLDTAIHGNRISGPVLDDGFDTVFDAVGSEQTLDDSFRMARPRGTIVLIGTSSDQKVDWSLVWARELTVRGTVYYGDEHVPATANVPGGRHRAMASALDILVDAQPSHLVTHVFPLDQPVRALSTAAAGPGASAVKVAFQPNR